MNYTCNGVPCSTKGSATRIQDIDEDVRPCSKIARLGAFDEPHVVVGGDLGVMVVG